MSIVKVNENFSPRERAAFLQEKLKSLGFSSISWVSSTGSTNEDLIAAGLKGSGNLSVIIADDQTAGRGRRNREWLSEKNTSLLMSVLFRIREQKEQLGLYSMKLSLAACHVLHELGFVDIRIKWPNDLIVTQGNQTSKLAGVLAQTITESGETLIVVGIGLNIFPGNLRQSLPDQNIIALSEIGDAPDRVLLAARMLEWLAKLDQDDSLILDQYASFVDTIGRKVRISTATEEIIGNAIAVNPNGSLLIELSNGEEREVFVGDVVHLR